MVRSTFDVNLPGGKYLAHIVSCVSRLILNITIFYNLTFQIFDKYNFFIFSRSFNQLLVFFVTNLFKYCKLKIDFTILFFKALFLKGFYFHLF